MNTRNLAKGQSFVASVDEKASEVDSKQSTDSIVFDKAEKAESVELLREKILDVNEKIAACNTLVGETKDEQAVEDANEEIAKLERRKARIELLIERKEDDISKS